MSEAVRKLLWLVPTCFLAGFIYSAIRSESPRQFLRQGLRQSISILVGMCVLGVIIYWISSHL